MMGGGGGEGGELSCECGKNLKTVHFALETHLFRDSNGISSKICSIIGRGAKRGEVPTGMRIF